jgi:thiosulfate dehydrogenase (quinone) large subunit
MAVQADSNQTALSDPPFFITLTSDKKWASFLWLVARLYLGYTWLTSGLGKLSNPAWMNGAALKGFWANAVAIPPAPAHPVIAYDWYRAFLTLLLDSGSQTWFAPLVAVSEFLIGTALILGLFTGFAALAGGFMNWNFVMAGTASMNGVFIVLSILIILAWKNAGWWGLDRWVLPLVGTPWQPGKLFTKKQ